MKSTFKRIVAAILLAVTLVLVVPVGGVSGIDFLQGIGIKAEAASYPSIPALKITRVRQGKNMCTWASLSTVQGYCSGTYEGYDYRQPGVDFYYGTGKTADLSSENDPMSKLITQKCVDSDWGSAMTKLPHKMVYVTKDIGNNTATYEKIYNQLKQGKPVIAYLGNYVHTSVIIAYNGSSTKLEASGFTVMDVAKDTWKNSKSNYNNYANNPQSITKYDSCYVSLSSWLSYNGGRTIKAIYYPEKAPTVSTDKVLSVRYNGNGGVISSDKYKLSSNIVYEGSNVLEQKWVYDKTKENGLYNASTFGLYRKGYTFAGWGTTSSGEKIFDQDDVTLKPSQICPDIKNGSRTITLYAIWKPITGKFSYNANGGSGSASELTVTFGGQINVKNEGFTRKGYSLKGWAVKRNGDNTWFTNGGGWQTESVISQKGYTKKLYNNDTSYTFNDSWIRAKVSSETYTFYAVWEKLPAVAPEIDTDTLSLIYKESKTVNVTNGVEVTWESSNPVVATVDDNGKVTAKRSGSAVITAVTSDGLKAECQVNVKMEWWQTLLKIISFGIY